MPLCRSKSPTRLRDDPKIEDRILTLASANGGLDEDPPKSFTDKDYPNYFCYEFRKIQPQKKNVELPKPK